MMYEKEKRYSCQLEIRLTKGIALHMVKEIIVNEGSMETIYGEDDVIITVEVKKVKEE